LVSVFFTACCQLALAANCSIHKFVWRHHHMIRLHKILMFGAMAVLGTSSIHANGSPRFISQIQGVWSAKVTIRDCVSGAPLTPTPTPGLITFHAGGTVSETAPAPPNTLRGPAHGLWHRSGRNAFTEVLTFQRFDLAGTYTGTILINAAATVADDSLSYTAEGSFTLMNPTGTVISTGCSAVTATRIK
jgi:hypothetical protein